jgi:hypothetical protein
MKKVVAIIFCFGIFIIAPAQDPLYKGPAKAVVDSFWLAVSNLETLLASGVSQEDANKLILSLDRMKDRIREKDRAYIYGPLNEKIKSLTKLEKQYRDEKNGIKTLTSPGISDETIKKINELLTAMFDVSLGEHKVPNLRSKAEAMDKNLLSLLALDRSGSQRTLARYLVRLNKKAVEAQNGYPVLEKKCLERTDIEMAAVDFYLFGYYRSYWDAARKIFPEESQLEAAYTVTNRILTGFGSVEKLEGIVSVNYIRQVKETMIPAPKIRDTGLEQLFMDAYNKMYSESFKGKALKAVILSDDWIIERNEISGVVTGRLRKGAIAYKNSEGKCYLIREFFIKQEYVNGAFVGTKSVYAVGIGQEMLCENLK